MMLLDDSNGMMAPSDGFVQYGSPIGQLADTTAPSSAYTPSALSAMGVGVQSGVPPEHPAAPPPAAVPTQPALLPTYAPPAAVQYVGQAPAGPAYAARQHPMYVPPEPSYWEKVWARRRDMVKLVVLALVVLLAISSHATIVHYLRLYLEDAAGSLEPWKEAVLRVAYPAAVLALLWHLKVVGSSWHHSA